MMKIFFFLSYVKYLNSYISQLSINFQIHLLTVIIHILSKNSRIEPGIFLFYFEINFMRMVDKMTTRIKYTKENCVFREATKKKGNPECNMLIFKSLKINIS